MNDLPAEWIRRPLESVAVVVAGQSPPSDSYNSTGVGIPFFQGKAEFGGTYPEVRKYTTAGTKFAEPGDVLLSVRAPVGPTNMAREYCAIGRGLMAVRARAGIDERFLLWAIRSRADHLAGQAAGSTFAAVTGKQVRSLVVPVPPPGEQRRIVDILEDHLSRLDAADAGLSLATRRAHVLVASTSGRLVSRASLVGEPSTIGEHAERVEYGSSSKTSEPTGPDDVPVLRMGNIQGGLLRCDSLKYLPAAHEEFPKLLLKDGDLLFNRTNSAELVGKSAVFEGTRVASFASYLIRVRFQQSLRPQWANLVLNSPQGREHIASVVSQQVGQANVNGTKLKAFPIAVPDVQIQERLVGEFESARVAADRVTGDVQVARRRSASLRRALLAAAFSGKLTGAASDIDHAEEIAS